MLKRSNLFSRILDVIDLFITAFLLQFGIVHILSMRLPIQDGYRTPLVIIFVFLFYWVYSAIFESSKYKGTVGKIILSIVVMDLEGNKLTFGKASKRFLGKIVTTLTLLIGYLIAFGPYKQTLHDKIANTNVYDKVQSEY
ncbi:MULTISPECIES: RDD family protein [unclassified Paenibacillus]|uniref:RDD family protein n=1 Tax=unclassified Paenibacillus TaxID=185978 RepID=UPI0036446E24